MLVARGIYWVAQITGWLSLSLLILFASLAGGKENEFTTMEVVLSASAFFGSGILTTHVMRLIYINMGWLDIKLGPLIPRILLSSVAGATAMTFIGMAVSLLSGKMEEVNILPIITNIIVTAIFLLMWNGLYFTFHFFQKSRVQEVKNLQLSASQNEIELKNLRSQLNPHFLFNSLNSIRALIDLHPVQATENLTKLSNLLRKSLILGKEKLILLKDELDMVNDYLDLEKVRFEERLSIIIRHDEELDNLPIPPFILQTLVENAFKHGISQIIQGGTIEIETVRNGSSVIIRVINDGKLGQSVDTGIGLGNTLRRLELQYGGNARFTLSEHQHKVLATIELKDQII